MQFITTGNRIAVENFTLGDLYTITFTSGIYINSACIGIGENFVSFQRNEPELLFTLNMETAELVSSIDLYAGGTGTNNYNDLTNKPQINDVELVENKALSDLGIQETISDLDTIRSGAAAGATAVQPAALADYQPTISDLDTIRSGAAAGATAVQPAALADYQPKIDSSHKLDADLVDDTSSTHKFATAAQLSQIGINENNILLNEERNGLLNLIKFNGFSTGQAWGVTYSLQPDGSVIVNGTPQSGKTSYVTFLLNGNETYADEFCDGNHVLYGCPSGGSENTYCMYVARSSYVMYDTGEGVVLSNTTATNILIIIRISDGYTANNLVFKPAIIDKAIWDNGFNTKIGKTLPNYAITPALIECVDNGKKNYLYYTLDILKVLNTNGTWSGNAFTHSRGVTFTVNSDMSISVSGTNNSGSDCAFLLMSTGYAEDVRTIPTGTYIASGCPTGGSNSTYVFYFWKGKTTSPLASYSEFGDSTSVYLDYTNASAEGSNISFIVKTNNTVNFMVYPMICKPDAWAVSHKYVPHAMSNAELTAAIQALQAQLNQ